MLDAWDPIGVGPTGPIGEYGVAVPPLMAYLRTGPTPEAVASWLDDWARANFSLEANPHETLVVAQLLDTWWTQNGDALPSGAIMDTSPELP